METFLLVAIHLGLGDQTIFTFFNLQNLQKKGSLRYLEIATTKKKKKSLDASQHSHQARA